MSHVTDSDRSLRERKRRSPLVKSAVILVIAGVVAASVALLSLPREERGRPLYLSGGAMPGGFYIKASGPTSTDLRWEDISIMLWRGNDSAVWNNISLTALASPGHFSIWHYGSPMKFGFLEVWLNVTDADGDGRLGADDRMNFTTGGMLFNATDDWINLGMMDVPKGSLIFNSQIDPTVGPVFLPSGPPAYGPGPGPAYWAAAITGAIALAGAVALGLILSVMTRKARRPPAALPPERP